MKKFILTLIILILTIILLSVIKENSYIKDKIFNEATLENTTEREETQLNFPKYKKIYNNEDFVGVISIIGTNLKEPIFQSDNNEYYLTHNGYKKEQKTGAIYLDFRFDIESSKKKIIYGHNFENLDTPFKILEQYYSKNYYNQHKYIELETENTKQSYEIFSVYVETYNWDYMNEPSDNAKIWETELKNMKLNSMYDTEVNVNSDDEILILQTCSTKSEYKDYENKYLLIIGKKCEEEIKK